MHIYKILHQFQRVNCLSVDVVLIAINNLEVYTNGWYITPNSRGINVFAVLIKDTT